MNDETKNFTGTCYIVLNIIVTFPIWNFHFTKKNVFFSQKCFIFLLTYIRSTQQRKQRQILKLKTPQTL